MVTGTIKFFKNNWILLCAVVLLGTSTLFIDNAPVVFSLFPKETCNGTLEKAEEYHGHLSDGLTNIYYYTYHDNNNRRYNGVSWAPALDSKRGLFWHAFPLMSRGEIVEVEYLRWFPSYSRIKGMRTRNLSMDLALFELVLFVFALTSNSKMMKNSKLFFNKNDS